MISYGPLWETLKQRNVSQYHLIQEGIDPKTLDSLRKNKNVTALTLEKLCHIIGCNPNDIIEFVEEERQD